MAHLDAGVEEDIYIETSGGYRQAKNQVGRLNKATCGLVHARLLWRKKLGQELLRNGLDRSQADPASTARSEKAA